MREATDGDVPAGVAAKVELGRRRTQYYMTYACEWKLLRLQCDEGQRISVARASYSRLNKRLCSDNTNFSKRGQLVSKNGDESAVCVGSVYRIRKILSTM